MGGGDSDGHGDAHEVCVSMAARGWTLSCRRDGPRSDDSADTGQSALMGDHRRATRRGRGGRD